MKRALRSIGGNLPAAWQMALTVAVLVSTATGSATARNLPIKDGLWTDAPSCADPSARDGGNARRFGPGTTSTANDDCHINIGKVRGKAYPVHLACTYVQGGGGMSDIVVTVVSPTEINWRGVDPAFETTYRFCGNR